MEAAFRQRLAQIHQEVKRRLDYQVAVQGVYKRVEREQAINYILGQVNQSIGATQVIIKKNWLIKKCFNIIKLKEKESFQSGLNTLKALSKKYANSI